MATLTSYETGQDGDGVIGDTGNLEVQNAQSFQISEQATITIVSLYLKRYATYPTDAITVRIETDNAGAPSGTLANANATGTIASASTTSSYAFVDLTFATPFILSASTTYHIRAYVPNQSTNVRYLWGRDETSPGYADGNENYSLDGGTSYIAESGMDLLFKVTGNLASSGFLTIL